MIIPISKSSAKIKVKKVAVDTNILYWFFYGNVIYARAYQKDIYPKFLEKLIDDKDCAIYTTIYNICELFNIIEKNEYDLYLQANGLEEKGFSKKDYRNIKEERIKIKDTIELIYQQIKNCINIEGYNIEKEKMEEYIQCFEQHNYDMFDFTLVNYCKEKNINYILTDDVDFSSSQLVDYNVNIITANNNIK